MSIRPYPWQKVVDKRLIFAVNHNYVVEGWIWNAHLCNFSSPNYDELHLRMHNVACTVWHRLGTTAYGDNTLQIASELPEMDLIRKISHVQFFCTQSTLRHQTQNQLFVCLSPRGIGNGSEVIRV